MPWDPDQYLRFRRERFAPFEDLLALLAVRPNLHVLDLGCGTGELTARLAAALPGSDVTGLDSSPAMLERARALARAGLRFELGRVEEASGRYDLVFSNAAIHWVEDHRALIPRLFALLNPGGQLLVQLPSNNEHPAHRAILEIAGREPFLTALGGFTRRSPVLSLPEYAELLYACGGTDLVVFEKVYPHLLPDSDAVAEWTSGTTLLPYFERLQPPGRQAFLAAYRSRLREIWPKAPVFYGFRRILFSAREPSTIAS
jgi:trans-aconitate 2-methyltransferase